MLASTSSKAEFPLLESADLPEDDAWSVLATPGSGSPDDGGADALETMILVPSYDE